MTWFTRSDILEIFRDAQDMLVHKSYARFADNVVYWFPPRIIQPLPPPLVATGPICFHCDEPSVRVVYGHSLCELHAIKRESSVRGSLRWKRWRDRRSA